MSFGALPRSHIRYPANLMVAMAWLLGGFPAALTAQSGPPPTPVRPVTDTLHGVPVTDSYRWLESGSDEVRAWYRAQDAYARDVLAALTGRLAILERLRAIGAAAPPEISLPIQAGGRWFFTIRRPAEPVPRLYVRDAGTGVKRLLVDPADIGVRAAAGSNRIATFRPSPDGRLIGVHRPGGGRTPVGPVRRVAHGGAARVAGGDRAGVPGLGALPGAAVGVILRTWRLKTWVLLPFQCRGRVTKVRPGTDGGEPRSGTSPDPGSVLGAAGSAWGQRAKDRTSTDGRTLRCAVLHLYGVGSHTRST
jgi:hypothetical protein